MKKIGAVIISLVTCFVFIVPNLMIAVNATETRYYNYSTDFKISGDGAVDMASVGLAQKNRTKSSLGYGEDWCADFVSDCAVLAKQATAIPFNGTVAALHSAVLNAGGSSIASPPQTGDLIFYYCKICEKYVHVGLMVDSQNSIQGNYSDKVSYVTNPSYYYDGYEHRCSDGSVLYEYVRPRYISNNNYKPSKPALNVNVGTTSRETVLEWNECEYTTHYDIRIYNTEGILVYAIGNCDDAIKFDNLTMYRTTSHSVVLEAGSYYAIVSAVNDDSGEFTSSDSMYFTVKVGPSTPTLRVNAGTTLIETVFEWNECQYATHYDLRVYNHDGSLAYAMGNFDDAAKFGEPTIFTSTNFSKLLGEGSYYATVSAVNDDSGEFMTSNSVDFSIYVVPSKPTLTVKEGTSSSDTMFEWDACECATHYDLRIYNSDDSLAYAIGNFDDAAEFGEPIMYTSTYFSKLLVAGSYYATVSAVNNDSSKFSVSDTVNFVVKEDITNKQGDVNLDGDFTVADVVMLQKWLLGVGNLTNWQNADLYEDGVIDVFDLAIMKNKLIYENNH